MTNKIAGTIPTWCHPDEPAWWEQDFSLDNDSQFLVISDHGGNKIPKSLNNLGLTEEDLTRHICYDIGANFIAWEIAKKLQCPVIASGFSRLVIDLNRPLDDYSSIRPISDGSIITGNRFLSAKTIKQRQEIFQLYHYRIQRAFQQSNRTKILISIHSFTPCLKKNPKPRPWHIALLSHQNRRYSDNFMATYQKLFPNDMVGDNVPYSGEDNWTYSILEYGVKPKRDYLVLEFRQDLVANEKNALIWANKVVQTIHAM